MTATGIVDKVFNKYEAKYIRMEKRNLSHAALTLEQVSIAFATSILLWIISILVFAAEIGLRWTN